MKTALLLITMIISLQLFANESKVCQKCHPIIYDEYYDSSHRKASTVNNPIHKAYWEKISTQERPYSCAKCHSPSDLKTLNTQKLHNNAIQREEPISCTYCHSISDVKKEAHHNTNVLTQKEREFYTAEKAKRGSNTASFKKESSFFGLVTVSKSSPYHKIDYNNENFYNGNVCMGCHSHATDDHDFDLLMLDALISKEDKNNCISCHMPQVMGSKVTLKESKTHAYHGIAGIYHQTQKMGDYVDITLQPTSQGFSITLQNQANHALFGQAMREGVLKVTIYREGKEINLAPYIMSRVLGSSGKEVPAYRATETLKDTLLYAKKEINYSTTLQKGDQVEVLLGFRLISHKAAKDLGLESNKELSKFRVMKKERFTL